tara:strand:- start:926 stop:3151 length:2226 start_codon:yes stop_codon:yes gene_type:complete
MDDKKTIQLIRAGRFSHLEFLESDELSSGSENYLGYLFFMQYLKSEPNSETLTKISEVKGGLDYAYEYLGRIAKKLFSYIHEGYIAESFFKLSLSINANNASAWWEIYKISDDEIAFLNSIKISYKESDFFNLNIKFNDFLKANIDLTEDEWTFLIEVLTDERVEKNSRVHGILVTAYSKVNKYKEGAAFIDDIYFVDVGVLKGYINSKALSFDTALSKVPEFCLEDFFDGDYSLVYEESLKRKELGLYNCSKLTVIETAFKAKRYSDVIKLYKESWGENSENCVDSKVYYLLSHLYEGTFDKDTYDEVIKSRIDSTMKKVLDVKLLIRKLYYYYKKDDDLKFPIDNWSLYSEAESLLEDSELINHYLYDEIYKELAILKEIFDEKYYKGSFDNEKLNYDVVNLTYDEFIERCRYFIDEKLFEEGLSNLEKYHQVNHPTIETYNLLGVFYHRLGDIEKAFNAYSQALKKMDKYKEYDDVVIGNYLSSYKSLHKDCKKGDYNYWRNRLNLALVESFQWSRHLLHDNPRLFKYSPLNMNSLDSLVNQYFYLPEKQQLNDPIEMPSISDIGKEHFIDKDYRICSFSKNDNSMLMWSHYTGDHQGIMVEYEFGYGLPTGFGISEVKYTFGQKRQVEKDKFIFNQYLLTKNKEWEYEEEVRLISYQTSKVYYERYSFPNPDRSKINARVLGITLGCNFPLSKLDFIKKIIIELNKNRNEAEPKIYLRKAQISEEKLFTLEYDYLEI